MSGGSYDYAYSRVSDMATDDRLACSKNVRRRAFARHLLKVSEAMQAIEWVDSCDRGEGDENAAIDACLPELAHVHERNRIADALESEAEHNQALRGFAMRLRDGGMSTSSVKITWCEGVVDGDSAGVITANGEPVASAHVESGSRGCVGYIRILTAPHADPFRVARGEKKDVIAEVERFAELAFERRK